MEEMLSAEGLFTMDTLLSFITLSLLEIVLGIDNLIFISLLVQNLPEEHRKKARFIGLGLAMGMRIAMLFGIAWLMQLTEPLITVSDLALSFKDLLLIGGGLFLIGKVTFEMHSDLAGEEEKKDMVRNSTLTGAIFQIILIDLVFSFDSVITAVAMTPHIPVIVAAVIVSMVVMLVASGWLDGFLRSNPTFKMLAFTFILLIGVVLVADGLHFHVPRGYIYSAFGFAIFVELLNTLASRRRKRLREKQKS